MNSLSLHRRRMHRFQRRSTTIIEVVVAIVILSVALPSLMMAFAEASVQSIGPYRQSIGSFLAIERMEEIVARRYRGTDGYDAITTGNFGSESSLSGFPGYARDVAVAFVDGNLNIVGSDQGYKRVTVTVSWDNGAGNIDVEHIFADF